MQEPWSKRHKRDFKGCQFSLSNSFANPLTQPELVELTRRKAEEGGRELLKLYNNHDLEYTPNGGSLDLRRDIARVVYEDKITAEHVLVFPGGQVAVQTAALAFAAGCHSIVFVPGYQSTVESPEWSATSAGVTKIPRLPQDNWQVDPKKIRQAIRKGKTKFLILNEPYNPAGMLMSAELQNEVIDICREHDIVILCDEVYRLLEHDPAETRIPAMANAYEKGISAVTMSKPWGGCGITIGWLACRDLKMIERLSDVQYFGTACVSRASEIQARMVLLSSDTIIQNRLTTILENKELLRQFIESWYSEWFEWQTPNAGAIAFVKFKGPLTSEELGQHLGKAGISMKPAYCFTDSLQIQNNPELKQYFRVGFGETKMPLALMAFGAFVEEHKEEWSAIMKSSKT